MRTTGPDMPKILLVEDDSLNLDMICRCIQREGFEVITAIDGPSGLAKARSERPSLILMDLSLPEIDGWEITRRLKGDAETAGIPIIALTAHTMEGDREKALAAGCDDYASKPVDIPTLLEQIRKLLS